MTEFSPNSVYDRRSEVEAIWRADETQAGEVFRLREEGLSVQQIVERIEGLNTPGPVYAAFALTDDLVSGDVTSAPSKAKQHAGRIRQWFWEADRGLRTISERLRSDLLVQEQALNLIANNPVAQQVEDEAAREITEAAEGANGPGVYVYTLPHYRRYPVDPETGRTLLKVGYTSVNMTRRVDEQAKATALPEDPILLRVYPTQEAAAVERRFHDMLERADHDRSAAKRSRGEWFLTSTKFLDGVAGLLDLEVVEVLDLDGEE